ncbi:MAG TPA: histidine phosphatase family protein, partial [Candidatus Binataceae bacterium]|nr:histidine phosphatase family protein [Candidatus Binataceae bacterium]
MPVLYYIRHGETDFNRQGRLQGRRDTVLNAHGRLQAAECADVLRDLFARDRRQAQDFGYISSPLKRARETMEILRAALDLEPHDYKIDARLIEIAYGEWEGLTLPEIEARNSGVLTQRERDKWDFAPPGGESYQQLAARIGEWYRSLTSDVVVTAHGGGVRALMAILDVVPDEQAT